MPQLTYAPQLNLTPAAFTADCLDETVARVALKRNALRQEKIVEEIEVMLSSAMALAERA